MIAKYFLNGTFWFEEEYIFRRKWGDGQSFVRESITYFVNNSEIIDGIYYVYCIK
jgi:hypothetical protein